MALFPVFITFVIFNLSIRLSHGEISDKISSPTGELLRGFDTRKAPSTKQPTKEKGRAEVPRFLLDLYRKRTHLRRGRLIEQESEIVRVFLQEPLGHNEHKGPLHHQSFFNLSTIPAKEKIKKAELRIYKKKPLSHNHAEGSFKISLFYLKSSKTKSGQRKNNRVFVASRRVSSKDTVGRWIRFDVTSAVKFWKERPGENFGVILSVQGLKAFSSDFRIGNHGRRAPFLVTYTANPQVKFKSTKTLKNCSKSQVSEEDDHFFHNDSTTTRNRAKRSIFRTCRRRWVYVNFKKLKWNWIIAPSGYSANYCEGICPTVLHAQLEPTNHAILQNILHRMDSRIPSPSCAPTKLHGISVLYKTSDRSIALTEYGGMVVSSCGCQ